MQAQTHTQTHIYWYYLTEIEKKDMNWYWTICTIKKQMSETARALLNPFRLWNKPNRKQTNEIKRQLATNKWWFIVYFGIECIRFLSNKNLSVYKHVSTMGAKLAQRLQEKKRNIKWKKKQYTHTYTNEQSNPCA